MNLVIISMDTLRADHLGSYGYKRPVSPTLDALAARGVRFADASSTSAWTTPAHASLFASRYPTQMGVVKFDDVKRPGLVRSTEVMLAEVLQQHGYRTQAFAGGGFVAGRVGFAQGFDSYRDAYLLEDYEDDLRRWLRVEARSPFFLFVHFYNCHRPYAPPAPYDGMFRGTYRGSYPVQRLCLDAPAPSGADLEYVISQYDGEIAHADHLLAGILRALDDTDRRRDTLLVFVSDHGDEFYEHGQCDHTHSLYQELLHVPLVMVGPGIPSAAVVESPVSIIDVAPTVLDYFGMQKPASMMGESLLPLLADQSAAAPYLFFETANKNVSLRGVRSGMWKMLFNGADEPAALFRLDHDPGELHSLLGEESADEVQARLGSAYKVWRSAMPDIPTTRTDAGPELMLQLRSLGYVQ